MANTFTCLHYHIIFSTKNREPWLGADFEQRTWEYMGGIARENGIKALQVGGRRDHVHLVLSISASLAISKALQLIKGGSSKWIHETLPDLAGFAWQDGYGAFTISKSVLDDVLRYVQHQHDHYRIKSFQEEFWEFLEKHGIEYDERYVWG